MLKAHQEVSVEVIAVIQVGTMVRIAGTDIEGYIDQSQHPSWHGEAEPPQVGDQLLAVVIDPDRTPPRLSARADDIEIAERLRSSS